MAVFPKSKRARRTSSGGVGRWWPPMAAVILLMPKPGPGAGLRVHDACRDVCETADMSTTCPAEQASLCGEACDLGCLGHVRGCSRACSGEASSSLQPWKQRSCLSGCREATDRTLSRLSGAVELKSPRLLPNSLGDTDLALSWSPPSRASLKSVESAIFGEGNNLTRLQESYVLQFQISMQNKVGEVWADLRHVSPEEGSVVEVEGLLPYTEYRFRVTWRPFGANATGAELASAPSLSVRTKAGGVPSAPLFDSVQQVESLRLRLQWRPPASPGGPLSLYRIRIRELNGTATGGGLELSRDVSANASKEEWTYLTRAPVEYGKKYNVTVAAVNRNGQEGPEAFLLTETPPAPAARDGSVPPPQLYFFDGDKLYRKGVEGLDIFYAPELVRQFSADLVSVDFLGDVVFVLDASATVHVVGGGDDGASTALPPTGGGSSMRPYHIKIDWLYKKIVLLLDDSGSGETELLLCGFAKGFVPDLTDCSSLDLRLPSRPVSFALDPYGGHAYWIDEEGRKLARRGWNCGGGGEDGSAEVVLERDEAGSLSAFLLDPAAGKILVPDVRANKLLLVETIGGGRFNVSETHTDYGARLPAFSTVSSDLFSHGGALYWTNVDGLNEETSEPGHGYQHTLHPEPDVRFEGAVLVAPGGGLLRPTPLPVNAVSGFQATFGSRFATARWAPLDRLGQDLGCGAWKKWDYELRVEDGEDAYVTPCGKNLTVALTGIAPDRMHTLFVRATSASGAGPWSETFSARSLPDGDGVDFWWASGAFLRESDPLYGRPEVVSATDGVIDIVGDDGVTVYANRTSVMASDSRGVSVILEVSGGGIRSLAFEPYARAVYVSVPARQTISRVLLLSGGAKGREEFVLPLVVEGAADLAVDSFLAQLCWSSLRRKVECSTLNGVNRREVLSAGKFGIAESVSATTVDAERHDVMALIRTYGPVPRHRIVSRSLWPSAEVEQTVREFEGEDFSGPMRWGLGKLSWVQGDAAVVTLDLEGKGLAEFDLEEKVETFNVLHSLRDTLPSGANASVFAVVPDSVDKESVRLGPGRTVLWNAVNNTNYGSVTYDVLLEFNGEERFHGGLTSAAVVAEGLGPDVEVTTTVRACSEWACSRPARKTIRTAEEVPGAPTRVRIFHEPAEEDSGASVRFTVRWDGPESENGKLDGFRVDAVCPEDAPSAERSFNQICNTDKFVEEDVKEAEFLMAQEEVLNLRGQVVFSVSARNGAGFGPEGTTEEIAGLSEAEFAFRPVPRLLTMDSKDLSWWFVDADDGRMGNLTAAAHLKSFGGEVVGAGYLAATEDLIVLRGKGELLRLNARKNSVEIVAAYDGGRARCLALDYLGRYAYVLLDDDVLAKTDLESSKTVKLGSIPDLFETPVKMEMDPFTGNFFVSGRRPGNKGVSMASFFVSRFGKLVRREPTSASCDCDAVFDSGVSAEFALRPRQRSGMPEVLLAGEKNGEVYLADGDLCKCAMIGKVGEKTEMVSGLAADLNNVYWLGSSGSLTAINLDSGGKARKVDLGPVAAVDRVVVACSLCQASPEDPTCLEPAFSAEYFEVLNSTDGSVTIRLPGVVGSGCGGWPALSLPPTSYLVYVSEMPKVATTETATYVPGACRANSSLCRVLETPPLEDAARSESFTVTELRPNTRYGIQIEATNLYLRGGRGQARTKEEDDELGLALTVKTSDGRPSEPRDVRAACLSPDSVLVEWFSPLEANGDALSYEVHYQRNNFVHGKTILDGGGFRTREEESARRNVTLKDLVAGERYKIWVVAKTSSPDSSRSADLEVTTFSLPNLPAVVRRGPRRLELTWTAPEEREAVDHDVVYFPRTNSSAALVSAGPPATQPGESYEHDLENLVPGTEYVLVTEVTYEVEVDDGTVSTRFAWPRDGSFTAATPSDRPLTPGTPYLLKKNDAEEDAEEEEGDGLEAAVYLVWKEAEAGIDYYELQAKEIGNNSTASESSDGGDWFLVYSDRRPRWPIAPGIFNSSSGAAASKPSYSFRVRARNEFGFGSYSAPSPPVRVDEALRGAAGEAARSVKGEGLGVMVAVGLAVFLVLCMVSVLFVITLLRRPWQDKKRIMAAANGGGGPAAGGMELKTLRALTGRGAGAAVGNGVGLERLNIDNPIYDLDLLPTDEEMALLPRIRWKDIEITKMLGSGAFGDVFEGHASGLRREHLRDLSPSATAGVPAGRAKVAVKSLRPSASGENRAEFLREATFMAMFRHPNVVRLLGVCLDGERNFLIVMELMEGGSLTTFLRNSRLSTCRHPPLSVRDLISVCRDVARGCAYLEGRRFVHRDLAARNCLVSSLDVDRMVVKIGDFGLTRDVYKKSYYKKSNGMFPVRWMAPESLADGVYTAQSDVWSFGVILWEVFTLGQQPYPGRPDNMDVFNFVRDGGRLDVPDRTPETLGHLMVRCWATEPDERPNFAEALKELEELMKHRHGAFNALVTYGRANSTFSVSSAGQHGPTHARFSTGGPTASTVAVSSQDSLKRGILRNNNSSANASQATTVAMGSAGGRRSRNAGVPHRGETSQATTTYSGLASPSSYLQLLPRGANSSANTSAGSNSVRAIQQQHRQQAYDVPPPAHPAKVACPPPPSRCKTNGSLSGRSSAASASAAAAYDVPPASSGSRSVSPLQFSTFKASNSPPQVANSDGGFERSDPSRRSVGQQPHSLLLLHRPPCTRQSVASVASAPPEFAPHYDRPPPAVVLGTFALGNKSVSNRPGSVNSGSPTEEYDMPPPPPPDASCECSETDNPPASYQNVMVNHACSSSSSSSQPPSSPRESHV